MGKIHGNGIAGIECKDGAVPTVVRNQIYGNKGRGVFCHTDGAGGYNNNTIYANTGAGFEVAAGANPQVMQNVIRDGTTHGLLATDKAKGTFELNTITANKKSNVVIENESDPTLKENKIAEGMAEGIVIQSAKGQLFKNSIFANGADGIHVSGDGADPTIVNNEISNGLGFGVRVSDGAAAMVEDNTIMGNMEAEVCVESGGNSSIRGNKLRCGNGYGVLARNGAGLESGEGVFINNEICEHGNACVAVMSGAHPLFAKNNIHSGKLVGILVCDEGKGKFDNNDVCDHTGAALEVLSGGNPKVVNSSLKASKASSGLVFHNDAEGTVEDCKVMEHAQSGIIVQSGANPTFARIEVFKNGGSGVVIKSAGKGNFEHCEIHENLNGEVQLIGDNEPYFRGGLIYGQIQDDDDDPFEEVATVSLKIGNDMTLLKDGTPERESFDRDFALGVATALNLPAAQVQIKSLERTAGMVDVKIAPTRDPNKTLRRRQAARRQQKAAEKAKKVAEAAQAGEDVTAFADDDEEDELLDQDAGEEPMTASVLCSALKAAIEGEQPDEDSIQPSNVPDIAAITTALSNNPITSQCESVSDIAIEDEKAPMTDNGQSNDDDGRGPNYGVGVLATGSSCGVVEGALISSHLRRGVELKNKGNTHFKG